MGTFLRIKNDRLLKDVLKIKLKRKCTGGERRLRWEQPVRKEDMQKEGTSQKTGGRSMGRQK
jgi:hypothetical protein